MVEIDVLPFEGFHPVSGKVVADDTEDVHRVGKEPCRNSGETSGTTQDGVRPVGRRNNRINADGAGEKNAG